jgi:hypothetical protein
MESKKHWFVIPIVSALVLAVAIGVVAFSSSRAASGARGVLQVEDATEEPLPWKFEFGGRGSIGHGGRFGLGTSFDYDAYLANELGVTVDELNEARQATEKAALDQAVTEGVITGEQADLMLAERALKQYIDPGKLLSEAFGIGAAELEAARESGQTLNDLLGDLEPEEIQDAMQSAYQDAVQQAIDDGVITQSQADQLQERGFSGRAIGRPGGDFHRHGGGFPMQPPAADSDSGL